MEVSQLILSLTQISFGCLTKVLLAARLVILNMRQAIFESFHLKRFLTYLKQKRLVKRLRHSPHHVFHSLYRAFSLMWPATMQIYESKRSCLLQKRLQLPKFFFGTTTWPPFHCFGTPIWPPWRHVKTLYTLSFLVIFCCINYLFILLWKSSITDVGYVH